MTTRRLVFTCFLLSGAAGLVYQVVWARQLTLFLGITSYAHTAVITAFMTGLALGSVVFGRIADRRSDHLRLFALLEIGVALYALSTPFLFSLLQDLYVAGATRFDLIGGTSHALRFVLAASALLVPTMLMGGTLPILVRGLTTALPRLQSETAGLYGINTLGATLGAFAAGYLLLPALGITQTVWVAAGINFLVACVILVLAPKAQRGLFRERQEDQANTQSDRDPGIPEVARDPGSGTLTRTMVGILLIGFAFSGFAALIYELAWIRALILVIGSSVYAFSATLATFLAGIALGSLLYRRAAARSLAGAGAGKLLAVAAVLEIFVGLSAVASLPLIGELPGLFLQAVEAGLHDDFAPLQLVIFGLCFLVMLPPTLALGAIFPLLASLYADHTKQVGTGVGRAYAANTAGTIVGALAGGLLLVPMLGVQHAVVAASAVHILVGTAFWTARPAASALGPRILQAAAVLALLGISVSVIPPWDRALMSSGVFYRPERTLEQLAGRPLDEAVRKSELLYYAEGVDGTVAVKQFGNERTLVINGKTDASSHGDLPTQVLLGQIPMLLHPQPRDALVIGLGSGITAGAIATHPTMEQTTVVEISEQVVEASDFFEREHGSVLKDPRVELVQADARNYLLASDRGWDVIVSEPSNPWISGVSNLFTVEAFELIRSRLKPGGIAVQWCHVYNLAEEDLASVLGGFSEVFPNVTVWIPSPGDLVLVGSEAPHALDWARVNRAMGEPEVGESLKKAGITTISALVGTYLMNERELAGFVSGAQRNTDDRPRVEFNAPRALYADTGTENMHKLTRHPDGGNFFAPVRSMATPLGDELLDAPALSLQVQTGAAATGTWQALWVVEWTLPASDQDEATPQAGVRSTRLLAWLEDGVETRIEAQTLDSVQKTEKLRGFVRQMLGGETVARGSGELACGESAHFGLGRTPDGRLALALVWVDVLPGGEIIRYAAYREIADPGRAGFGEAVGDLMMRFRCRDG